MSALYRGFSLHQYTNTGSTKTYNIDLVKRNLLTHIYTSKGERLGMTTFGTRIPDLIFEPLSPEAVQIVQEDLEMVFNYDPRVTLNSITVIPIYEQNAIIATADITYVELNTRDPFVMQLQFG